MTTTDYGPVQAARHLGIEPWKFNAARTLGLIPSAETTDPDRWTDTQLGAVDLDAVRARIGTDPAIGTVRAVERLQARIADLAGADVVQVDHNLVNALVDLDLLPIAGWYRNWPLYLPCDLDRLTTDDLTAANRAAETTREVTTAQAVARLGIRSIDFARLHRAGLITPARIAPTQWNNARLWAVADLDALTATDLRPVVGADWPALRSLRPGERSPLHHLPARPLATLQEIDR